MVEETSAPVRRLLFTRAPPSPQLSSKTPFEKFPDTHGKDVNSGEVNVIYVQNKLQLSSRPELQVRDSRSGVRRLPELCMLL